MVGRAKPAPVVRKRKPRKPKKPKANGRPPHKPNHRMRLMVQSMAGYGIDPEEIASVVGISKNTLLKHYPDEIKTGKVKAIALVAESLFRRATSKKDSPGAVTAAIFWLKAQGGWQDGYVGRFMPGGGGAGGKGGESLPLGTKGPIEFTIRIDSGRPSGDAGEV